LPLRQNEINSLPCHPQKQNAASREKNHPHDEKRKKESPSRKQTSHYWQGKEFTTCSGEEKVLGSSPSPQAVREGGEKGTVKFTTINGGTSEAGKEKKGPKCWTINHLSKRKKKGTCSTLANKERKEESDPCR